jgi:hypothetical protein
MPRKKRYTFQRETRLRVALTNGMRTTAASLFNAHCQEVDALLCMVFSDRSVSPDDTDHSRSLLQARVELINEAHSGPWAIDVQAAMLRWQIVVQVAAVEVYLKDALATFALFNPDVLRGRSVRQEWSYEQVAFSSHYDRTLHDFCARWARNVVDGGGPKKWVERLEGMGASGFNSSDTELMRVMWALRNLHVHHGGNLTPEFIDQHRAFVTEHGEKAMSLAEWLAMRDASRRFVNTTDDFISERLQALMGSRVRNGDKGMGQRMIRTLAKHRAGIEAEPELDEQRRLAAIDRRFGERMLRRGRLLQEDSYLKLAEEFLASAAEREDAIGRCLVERDKEDLRPDGT